MNSNVRAHGIHDAICQSIRHSPTAPACNSHPSLAATLYAWRSALHAGFRAVIFSSCRLHRQFSPRCPMKINRTGLVFCALYATATCACFAMAFSSSDFKGRFVFLQLPIALQHSALSALGFGPLLTNLSWVAAYVVIAIPTFGLLYVSGWLIECLLSDNED